MYMYMYPDYSKNRCQDSDGQAPGMAPYSGAWHPGPSWRLMGLLGFYTGFILWLLLTWDSM